MPEGTYTLILERTRDATIEVGALGEREFPRGWYAYTGSAFGPGGFGRIERHQRVASGDHAARHWHVDYLLGDPGTKLQDVVRSVDADVECAVARRLDGEPIPDFGCSDCDCASHLAYRTDGDALRAEVERAHRRERE